MRARLIALLANRVLGRVCVLCALAVEPVCHALSLPHPEGLASIAMNYLMTTPTTTKEN